jgi:hypothetical protein
MLGSAKAKRMKSASMWVLASAVLGFSILISGSGSVSADGVVEVSEVNAGTADYASAAESDILDHATDLIQGLTIAPNQTVQISVKAIDAAGSERAELVPAVNDNTDANQAALSTVKYDWYVAGGSTAAGAAVIQAGDAGGPVDDNVAYYTATGDGVINVEVFIYQLWDDRTFEITHTTTINVVTPVAVAAEAMPTNPGTPPASIANADAVVAPESALVLSSTGVESGGTSSATNRPVVSIPVGAVNNFFGAKVSSVVASTLPSLPSQYAMGSSAANITFFNASGVAQDTFTLLRAAQVCLPTSEGDLVNGMSNVKVLRFNTATNQWVTLNSSYDLFTKQVCGSTMNFSNFAVGVQETQSSAETGANLPATGGWSPTNGLLSLIGVLGFLLVGGGFVTMRRAKQAARPE